MAILETKSRKIVFSTPGTDSQWPHIHWNLTTTGLNPADLKILERRLNVSPVWTIAVNNVGISGETAAEIRRGDIYECAIVDLKGSQSREFPGDLAGIREYERIQITTILQLNALNIPSDQPFSLIAAGTYVDFNLPPGFPFSVEMWLTERPVALAANSFVDPNTIPILRGIDGAELHAKVDAGALLCRIVGKLPGRQYSTLILFQDPTGAFFFSSDGSGLGNFAPVPAFLRQSQVSIVEIHVVDDGDDAPKGAGEVKGRVELTSGREPPHIWLTSLSGDEMDVDSGTSIPLSNGNLGTIYSK